MALFAPVFALGKGTQRTVSTFTAGTVSATVVCSVAVSPIAVGNHVFVSDADGGHVEYLGKVLTAVSSTLTTSLPGQRSRSAGALVWTPAASWQATSVLSAALRFPLESGIEQLDTTGSGPVHTRIRDRRDLVQFAWDKATRADWLAFKGFWEDSALDGLQTITAAFVDADTGYPVCHKVRVMDPGRKLEARHDAYRLRSWQIEVVITQQEAYL